MGTVSGLKTDVLRRQVARHAEEARGVVGVSVAEVGGEPISLLDGDRPMCLASVAKIPVALKTLHDCEQGTLALDEWLEVRPEDYSPPATIDAHFPFGGVKLTVANLLATMIRDSDNTAADVLMRRVGGPSAIVQLVQSHGIDGIRVDRETRALSLEQYGVPDMGALRVKLESLRSDPDGLERARTAVTALEEDPRDRATPSALVRLLNKLAQAALLGAKHTAWLLSILSRTDSEEGRLRRLRGMLPRGTPVAHKSGTLGGVCNDVGIVTLPDDRRYVVAVCINRSAATLERREQAIAEISRTVYDYYLFQA